MENSNKLIPLDELPEEVLKLIAAQVPAGHELIGVTAKHSADGVSYAAQVTPLLFHYTHATRIQKNRCGWIY